MLRCAVDGAEMAFESSMKTHMEFAHASHSLGLPCPVLIAETGAIVVIVITI